MVSKRTLIKRSKLFYHIHIHSETESSGDYEDTEDDDDLDTDMIMPSRIQVPTEVSPSFENPTSFGNVIPTKIAPTQTKTKAFDVIKTALFDDSESEGSGSYPDQDYDQQILTKKIVPSKTMTENPRVESSPSFAAPPTPREPVIVTTALPPPALSQPPIVQKKLQKHAVVAGRALKIQV